MEAAAVPVMTLTAADGRQDRGVRKPRMRMPATAPTEARCVMCAGAQFHRRRARPVQWRCAAEPVDVHPGDVGLSRRRRSQQLHLLAGVQRRLGGRGQPHLLVQFRHSGERNHGRGHMRATEPHLPVPSDQPSHVRELNLLLVQQGSPEVPDLRAQRPGAVVPDGTGPRRIALLARHTAHHICDDQCAPRPDRRMDHGSVTQRHAHKQKHRRRRPPWLVLEAALPSAFVSRVLFVVVFMCVRLCVCMQLVPGPVGQRRHSL